MTQHNPFDDLPTMAERYPRGVPSIHLTPQELDATIAKAVREAWPMLAESATYWKERHDEMLRDFQTMAANLNQQYERPRANHNPSPVRFQKP